MSSGESPGRRFSAYGSGSHQQKPPAVNTQIAASIRSSTPPLSAVTTRERYVHSSHGGYPRHHSQPSSAPILRDYPPSSSRERPSLMASFRNGPSYDRRPSKPNYADFSSASSSTIYQPGSEAAAEYYRHDRNRDYYRDRGARLPPYPHAGDRPPSDYRVMEPRRDYYGDPHARSDARRFSRGFMPPVDVLDERYRSADAISPSKRPRLMASFNRRVFDEDPVMSSDSAKDKEKITEENNSEDEIKQDVESELEPSKNEKGEPCDREDTAVQELEVKKTKATITGRMDKLDDEISKYEDLLEQIRRAKLEGNDAQNDSNAQLAEKEEKIARPSSPLSKRNINRFIARSFAEKEQTSLYQKIIKENREKSKRASTEGLLRPLSYDTFLAVSRPSDPLYQRYEDLPFYRQNLKKFKRGFKHLLMQYLAHKKQLIKAKERDLIEQYLSLENEWLSKVTRQEALMRKKQVTMEMKAASRSTSTRPKDLYQAGTNDFVFPYINLKPQTEDDFRYLKTLILPAPMIIDANLREHVKYIDRNRVLDESIHTIRLRNAQNAWSDEEKQVFIQKFLDYPKEFGQIASFLPNKSPQDCVLYYYLNKKSLKLKSLMRQALAAKNRRKRKSAGNGGESRGAPSPTFTNDESVNEVTVAAARATSVDDTARKVQQAGASKGAIPDEKKNWTVEDLAKAREAFLIYGKDFIQVAMTVGNRTVLQCRLLYKEYLLRDGVDLTDPEEPVATEDEDSKSKNVPKASKNSTQSKTEDELTDKEGSKKGKRIKKKVTEEEEQVTASLSPVPNESAEDLLMQSKKDKEKRRTVSYWSAKEKSDFLELFKQYGRNWKKVSEFITTKSEIQIRNYYQNNKSALGLVGDKRPAAHQDHSNSSAKNAGIKFMLNSDESLNNYDGKPNGHPENRPIVIYPNVALPQNIYPYPYHATNMQPQFPASNSPVQPFAVFAPIYSNNNTAARPSFPFAFIQPLPQPPQSTDGSKPQAAPAQSTTTAVSTTQSTSNLPAIKPFFTVPSPGFPLTFPGNASRPYPIPIQPQPPQQPSGLDTLAKFALSRMTQSEQEVKVEPKMASSQNEMLPLTGSLNEDQQAKAPKPEPISEAVSEGKKEVELPTSPPPGVVHESDTTTNAPEELHSAIKFKMDVEPPPAEEKGPSGPVQSSEMEVDPVEDGQSAGDLKATVDSNALRVSQGSRSPSPHRASKSKKGKPTPSSVAKKEKDSRRRSLDKLPAMALRKENAKMDEKKK